MKKLILFMTFLMMAGVGALNAEDDFAWKDFSTKEIFDSSVEGAKGGNPKQVLQNASRLISAIRKKELKADKKSELQARNRRHKRCHFKANRSSQEMLNKFKALAQKMKSGDCGDQAGPAVKELQDKINAWDGEQGAMSGACQKECSVWPPRDQAVCRQQCFNSPTMTGLVVNKVGGAVGAMAKTAETLACAEDLTASDALNITGEVIAETGQVGMMDPGMTGKGIAAASTGIGAVFKLISNLVKLKWDFKQAEHRESWITINCQFLELNNQLEQSGIMGAFTGDEQQELNELNKTIPRLKDVVKNFQVAIEDEEAKMGKEKVAKQKVLLRQKLGKANMRLYMRLKATTEMLQTIARDPVIFNDKIKKGMILKDLFGTYKEFFKYIDKANLNKDYAFMIPTAKNDFKNVFRGPNTEQAVIGKFLNQNKPYLDLVSYFMDNISWIYDELDKQADKALLGSSSITKPIILTQLEEAKEQIQERLYKMEKLKRLFESQKRNSQGGKTEHLELVKIYDEIQDSLFGRAGNNYLEIVVKQGTTLMQKWKKRIHPLLNTPNKICQLRTEINAKYTGIDSYIDTAYDFMRVNNYLFQQESRGKFVWIKAWRGYLNKQYENSNKIKVDLSQKLKTSKDTINMLTPQQKDMIMKLLKSNVYHQPLTTLKKNTPIGNLMLRRLLVRDDYVKLAKLAKIEGCNL